MRTALKARIKRRHSSGGVATAEGPVRKRARLDVVDVDASSADGPFFGAVPDELVTAIGAQADTLGLLGLMTTCKRICRCLRALTAAPHLTPLAEAIVMQAQDPALFSVWGERVGVQGNARVPRELVAPMPYALRFFGLPTVDEFVVARGHHARMNLAMPSGARMLVAAMTATPTVDILTCMRLFKSMGDSVLDELLKERAYSHLRPELACLLTSVRYVPESPVRITRLVRVVAALADCAWRWETCSVLVTVAAEALHHALSFAQPGDIKDMAYEVIEAVRHVDEAYPAWFMRNVVAHMGAHVRSNLANSLVQLCQQLHLRPLAMAGQIMVWTPSLPPTAGDKASILVIPLCKARTTSMRRALATRAPEPLAMARATRIIAESNAASKRIGDQAPAAAPSPRRDVDEIEDISDFSDDDDDNEDAMNL